MPATRHVPLPHLREWREHRLMSQAEVKDKTGLAIATISNLENGKAEATYGTIAKLAEALGISREQLVREKP